MKPPAPDAPRTASILLALALMLAGCDLGGSGVELAPGWEARSLTVWRHAHPDMLAPAPDGKSVYVSCETAASMSAPSLAVLNPASGHATLLVSGLHRADALKFAPDGSLWIGEEFERGMIWRIAEPGRLPADQIVERSRLASSHPSIAPLPEAGVFAHEGLAFSNDGRHAYLGDEDEHGALYRLDLSRRSLSVLTDSGWRAIPMPAEARAHARRLGARRFNRLEDFETLPDGRILMAETGTGRILALDDRGAKPSVSVFLERKGQLKHPDNLAWDESRRWLWITDDDRPSRLWAWTGRELIGIARHSEAEITGVVVHRGDVLINLQRAFGTPEITLRLRERR